MNTWNFSGPRLKINRAKTHLKELDSRLAEWYESDSFRIFIDKNPDTGNPFFQFSCAEAIPEDIPLIIGDIIHNLRSALDYIAIEIVGSTAALDPERAYFPIRDTKDAVLEALFRSGLKLASLAAADVIMNRIKPYKARNPFIWSLNRLSNTDKHRLLIPVLARARFSDVSLDHDDKVGPKIINVTVNFGGTVARSGDIVGFNGSYLAIKHHGRPALTIFFDEAKITERPEIPGVLLLNRCAELIQSYIRWFESI